MTVDRFNSMVPRGEMVAGQGILSLITSLFLFSLLSAEDCFPSRRGCEKRVWGSSGEDVSLVCISDGRSLPAWCASSQLGYALPSERLYAVAWFHNGMPVTQNQSQCTVKHCQGFYFELEGRSLVLADATPSMSGNYTCTVQWRNSTCCGTVTNRQTVIAQRSCPILFSDLQGFFLVNISDTSVHPVNWSEPYPWTVSAVIFGNISAVPVISSSELMISNHQRSPYYKASYWKPSQTNIWFLDNHPMLQPAIVMLQILQAGSHFTFSCAPDSANPMVTRPHWFFGPPGFEFENIEKHKNVANIFLERRWSLYIENASQSLSASWLACEMNNSVEGTKSLRYNEAGAEEMHIMLEVNGTSDTFLTWGPLMPTGPFHIENVIYGHKANLCAEVVHTPSNGRFYLGCYEMEIKCAPGCNQTKLVNYKIILEQNVLTTPKTYKFCFQPFYAVTTNRSYVWEAYEMRNPRRVLYHVVDFYVAIPPVGNIINNSIPVAPIDVTLAYTVSPVMLFVFMMAVVVAYVGYKYYKKTRQPPGRHILLQVDNNPMYGQVESDSALGSPRSTSTAFSFMSGDTQLERRLSNSPGRDPSPDEHLYITPCDEWEVSRDKIHIEKVIGAGEFGEVYQGWLKSSQDEERMCVAIKMTKEDATSKEVADLKSELHLLKEITSMGGHVNVIRLVGCCTFDTPVMVLTEYATNGDLKNYLIQNRMMYITMPRNERDAKFIQYSKDIASGMKFLASKKIVHRDLAARNVLVAADLTLKITDFGLTKHLTDKPYYRICNHTLLPVKWMAPECVQEKKFTHMSDVWSFGVVMWEICSQGETPYSEIIDPNNLMKRLAEGLRLRPPTNSPQILRELMELSWKMDPEERPSFKEILERLKG